MRLNAICRFHRVWLPWVKVGMTMVNVFTSVPTNRLAKRYSFHAKIQHSIATEIMPGSTSGRVTLKNALSGG